MEKTYWQKLWQDARDVKFAARIIPDAQCPEFSFENSSKGCFFLQTKREQSVPMYTWIVPSSEPDAPLFLYLPWTDSPKPDFASLAGKYTIAVTFWPEYALAEAVREWETISSALADPLRFSNEKILDVLCVIRWIFKEKKSKNRLVIAGSSYGATLALMLAAVLQKFTTEVIAIQPSFSREAFNMLMLSPQSLTMPVLMQSDMAELDARLFRALPLKGFNRIGGSIPEFLKNTPESANPMLGKNTNDFPEMSEEVLKALRQRYCQIKVFFTEDVHRMGSAIVEYYIKKQEQNLYPRVFNYLDETFCTNEKCVDELVLLLEGHGIYTIKWWGNGEWYIEGKSCE